MIQNVFRAEGLPLDLAYIPLIESAFKPNALSRAKAKGVWQFMRGTALENGLRHDWYIDERSDPEKATVRGGEVSADAEQDVRRRLAPGAGVVQRRAGPRAARRQALRPRRFLDADARASKYLPARDARVRADDSGGNHHREEPGAVRVRVSRPSEPVAYEKVHVPRAVDLRRVAEWTGTSIDEIQALNPELRRWTTPVRYAEYEVKVPVGTADQLRANAWRSPLRASSPRSSGIRQAGETLATIARKLRVSRSDLAEANNLSR